MRRGYMEVEVHHQTTSEQSGDTLRRVPGYHKWRSTLFASQDSSK